MDALFYYFSPCSLHVVQAEEDALPPSPPLSLASDSARRVCLGLRGGAADKSKADAIDGPCIGIDLGTTYRWARLQQCRPGGPLSQEISFFSKKSQAELIRTISSISRTPTGASWSSPHVFLLCQKKASVFFVSRACEALDSLGQNLIDFLTPSSNL